MNDALHHKPKSQIRYVFFSIFAVVFVVSWAMLAIAQLVPDNTTVRIGDDIFVEVDLAVTPLEHEKGLSGREELANGEGMLFIFGRQDVYTFWMKGMLIPIDILWIRDGVLVDMSVDVPPPVEGGQLAMYFPREPVDAVLEVPAGFAQRHGLRLGLPVIYNVDSAGQLR